MSGKYIMRKSIRGNKIMFIFRRRITQVFFLIPLIILGLLIAPVSYGEKLNASLAKATYGPVTGKDTLGRIVSRHYSGSNLSTQQIMTGILRANPEAFIGGNIHFLLRGSTLFLPKEHLIETIKQSEAERIIKEHYRYFQRGKTGNFKIKPLVPADTISDTRDFEKDAAFILSEAVDDEIEINAQDNKATQTVPPSETGNTKKSTNAALADNKTVQSQKLTNEKTGSSIKDIELESLKIKISRLEKILSSRGISSSALSGKASKELNETLEKQKAKIDQLEQEKKSKNKELEQLKRKISELESSLKKVSQSLAEKENAALSTADGKNTLLTQLKKENIELKSKLSSLQLELDQKIKEVASLTKEINESKQTISNLEIKLLASDKENLKLDQQIAEMEAKLAKIRQEPARNLEINGGTNTNTLGFNKYPWIWLLPVLFLLSILAYLFKRSFSQPKKALDTVSKTTERKSNNTQKVVVQNKEQQRDKNKTSSTVAKSTVPDIISSASEEESLEASIKLDIAKAYMDMDMPDAAIEILQEAYEEGSNKQRLEAKNLLEKLA